MRLTSLMSSADGALGGSELRRPRLGEVSCDDRRGSRRNDDEIYNKNKKAKKKSMRRGLMSGCEKEMERITKERRRR